LSSCQDSDSLDYNQKGNVTLNVSGEISVVEDFCSGDNLTEMVCNSDGTASKINHLCDSGCSGGKCNETPASPSAQVDSEGYSSGRSRTIQTSTSQTTNTAPASTIVSPAVESSQGSNGNSEGTDTQESSVGSQSNNEQTTPIVDPKSTAGVSKFIETFCNIVNPFDKRGYNSCVSFFKQIGK